MASSNEINPIDDQSPLLHQATEDEIQEGEKIDHLNEMKERNGQDQLGSHAKKSLNQIYDERFMELDITRIKSCTIFKVNVELRNSNREAYTPMLISIGPYHKKNEELRSMEKYKTLYLRRFLQRKARLDVESCISEIEKLKDKVLNCYDNIEGLDSDIISKFSEIIFRDGCFVVEFIRECHKREDRIINREYMRSLACRDLLLLENQLPFFVLTKLHDMTKDDEKPFAILVKETFSTLIKNMDPASPLANYLEGKSHAEIKHLLEVVHTTPHRSYWDSHRSIKRDENRPTWEGKMPNATELCEAGVTFSKVENIDSDLLENAALFDIKFENGQMKIPCFQVEDQTETLLRNLVAYEQESYHVHSKCFSDFVVFMDFLIDSNKDVNLLRQKGIISNLLEDDNAVANIFNKIAQGIIISTDFYYEDVCQKAIEHCEKSWNRMMANLRSNYFHSPWAGLSTVAAIILLFLTATQTVLSFISLFKKSS